MAARAYALLDNYIYGFALQERGVLVATPQEMQDVGAEIVDRVAAGEYPDLKQVGIDLLEASFDCGFEFGLDGIARMPQS